MYNIAQLQVKLAAVVERAEAAEATEFHLRAELADLQGEYAERTGEMMGYSASAAVAQSRVKDLELELAEARSFIDRAGYRRCDSAACNCGSWHRGHASQRLQEIADVLPWWSGSTMLDRVVETVADAGALRALAAWTNSGPMCGRRAVICESYTRDRPFYRVELDSSPVTVNAEHSDLAAAIMDALWKAEKV